jgi:hypothetical protein
VWFERVLKRFERINTSPGEWVSERSKKSKNSLAKVIFLGERYETGIYIQIVCLDEVKPSQG